MGTEYTEGEFGSMRMKTGNMGMKNWEYGNDKHKSYQYVTFIF